MLFYPLFEKIFLINNHFLTDKFEWIKFYFDSIYSGSQYKVGILLVFLLKLFHPPMQAIRRNH
jgi:hypothetical protein